MARDVISTCPVCSSELFVTRLQCRSCGTAIEGDFSVGRFGRLSRDQLALLESFLRARGNLKELERELKLSYPTVRARIDALVRALGLADGAFVDDSSDDGSGRDEIGRAAPRGPGAAGPARDHGGRGSCPDPLSEGVGDGHAGAPGDAHPSAGTCRTDFGQDRHGPASRPRASKAKTSTSTVTYRIRAADHASAERALESGRVIDRSRPGLARDRDAGAAPRHRPGLALRRARGSARTSPSTCRGARSCASRR